MILQLIVLVVLLQAIGFVWYGPLFGRLYANILGFCPPDNQSPEEKKAMQRRMMPLYITNLFINALTAFAFVFFLQITLFYPIALALFLFVGFMLPVEASKALWSGKSRKDAWKLFGIGAGFQLIAFLVMGIFYTLW